MLLHGEIFISYSIALALYSQPCFLSLSLSQVCEVYKLHRETFYLAQDYFDRFMATQTNVFKCTLQLIGISSLFIAAKMEVGRGLFYNLH